MKKFLPLVAMTLVLGGGVLTLAACESAILPASAGIGPQPQLPPPNPTLLPTVNIAPAVGWLPGETPVAAAGLAVVAFAAGLDHPRNLLVLPNGDVLVAETNAPPSPMMAAAFAASSCAGSWARPVPVCQAPTASSCFATPMAMASPRRVRRYWKG